ncbi:MAG: hypothetical protein U5K27_03190 [Desulfotignum sp.]|nr:hypothetical protein [Desulfotignum sp.]
MTALIMIDEDNVAKYAQDHKIQFSTYRDLTQSPEVIDLVDKEVKAVNHTLARVETSASSPSCPSACTKRMERSPPP